MAASRIYGASGICIRGRQTPASRIYGASGLSKQPLYCFYEPQSDSPEFDTPLAAPFGAFRCPGIRDERRGRKQHSGDREA
jgi:hypothetical protein